MTFKNNLLVDDMVTTLGEYDADIDTIVAYPASVLSENVRFKKAYKMLYPGEDLPFIYNKYCLRYATNPPSYLHQTKHIARNDIYHLSPNDVRVVNHIGLEGLGDIQFYKVPKNLLHCLTISNDRSNVVVIDESRFIIQELQRQYDIPEKVLFKAQQQTWVLRQQIRPFKSQYDDDEDCDEEEE